MSPILSVQAYIDGSASGTKYENLLVPSVFQWNLADVSQADAGRTESFKMLKLRGGQVRTINLEWWAVSLSDAVDILNAFNSEYIQVKYLDAMTGGYETKVFYVGDRVAPLYNVNKGLWERIGFNIIQQEAK